MLTALGLLLAGCTAASPQPDPVPNGDTPERAAAQLAAGLAKKDLSPRSSSSARRAAEVNALFKPLVAGMGPLTPRSTVAAVNP